MKNNRVKEKQWVYEAPKLNTGKEFLDDMSLIVGMYGNYIVTKTGYLVGMIETTGVNVDLLDEYEQEDIFNSYNAFLMSIVGNQQGDRHQYIELTIPVNMTEYILNLKTKYIQAKREPVPNVFLIQLIASYIDYYSKLQSDNNMTTKKHLVVIRIKIKNRSLEELELAKGVLNEKMDTVKRNLETSFEDVDMVTNILIAHEVTSVLKTLINFKS